MINLKDPSFVGMTKKSLTNSSWFEWLFVSQAVIPVTLVVIPVTQVVIMTKEGSFSSQQ